MFGQRVMEHKDVLIMPNAIEAETYAYDPMAVSYTHLDVYKRQI